MTNQIIEQLKERELKIAGFEAASRLFFSQTASNSFFSNYDKISERIITPEKFEQSVIDYGSSLRRILDSDPNFSKSADHLLKDFYGKLKALDEKYLFTYKHKHLLQKKKINELEEKDKYYEERYRELDQNTFLNDDEKTRTFYELLTEHQRVKKELQVRKNEVKADIEKYNEYIEKFNIDLSVTRLLSDMNLILGTILQLNISPEAKEKLYKLHDTTRTKLSGIQAGNDKSIEEIDKLCEDYGLVTPTSSKKKIKVGKTFKMPEGTVDEKGNPIIQVSVLDPELIKRIDEKEESIKPPIAEEIIEPEIITEKTPEETIQTEYSKTANQTANQSEIASPEILSIDEEVLEPITIERKDPFARYNLSGMTEEKKAMREFNETMRAKQKDIVSRMKQGISQYNEEYRKEPAIDLESIIKDIHTKRKFNIGDVIEFNGFRGAYMNNAVYRCLRPGDKFIFKGYGSNSNKIKIEGTYIDLNGNVANIPENQEFFIDSFELVKTLEQERPKTL